MNAVPSEGLSSEDVASFVHGVSACAAPQSTVRGGFCWRTNVEFQTVSWESKLIEGNNCLLVLWIKHRFKIHYVYFVCMKIYKNKYEVI